MREAIYNIATGITPFDQIERNHIDFIRHWIESGAEIFRLQKPDKPDTHLVSYICLIDPETLIATSSFPLEFFFSSTL